MSIVTDERIVRELRAWIETVADSDELAELADIAFGGKLTPREDGDYDFQPDENYCGAYADGPEYFNVIPQSLCENFGK
jgi:hypothetical protein